MGSLILLFIIIVVIFGAIASSRNNQGNSTTTEYTGRRISRRQLPEWEKNWTASAESDYEPFLKQYAATYEEEEAAKKEVAENTEEVCKLRERIESEVQGNLFSERYYLHATADMLYLALLAQRQKLPRKIAIGGLTCGNDWRSMRSFIVWYGEELCACGFPYEMLYSAGMTENVMISESFGMYPKKAEEALNGSMGFFYWHPNRGKVGQIGSQGYIVETGYENYRRCEEIRKRVSAYDQQMALKKNGIETSAFKPDEIMNLKWAEICRKNREL